MTYSVYIVDDDILIINNLIQSVPWLDNGFEIVGNSTDPHDAVKEIVKLRPHVVFSDLKMPSMTGNQLIKTLKEQGVDCEFIMLSAFSDFEDARTFFLLNGFDYLLKPLLKSDAQMVLEKLSCKLNDKYPPSFSMNLSASSSESFNQMIQYITAHYANHLTLVSLSQQFHINPNYICNLFAKHYHCSFTVFLTNLRMLEASKLICTSNKSFKEIAICCGYSDYFYFCKVFKKHFNRTPSQYKEQKGGVSYDV